MLRIIHRYLWKKLKHSISVKIFLYRLVWLLPSNLRKPDLVWTQPNKLAKRQQKVTFINIGANDGLSGDPLIEFIFRNKWQGLLVEPIPYVFERLTRVYRNQPQVRCVNVAVAEESSQKKFYYLEDTKQLPPGSDQIVSFDKNHLLKHEDMFPNLQKHLKTMVVTCTTLSDLLRSHNLSKAHLYLIDTEGYDYEVLKLIDFKKHKP